MTGVIGAELAIGAPLIAHLMLPSIVFTHLNGAMRAACRPDPVRIA